MTIIRTLTIGLLVTACTKVFSLHCKTLLQIVDAHNFETNRYFSDYAYMLGSDFIKKYQTLTKHSHIFFPGAGNLKVPIQHFTGKIGLYNEKIANITDYCSEYRAGKENKITREFYKFIEWFRSSGRRGDPTRQANVTANSYKIDSEKVYSARWLFGQDEKGSPLDFPKEKFNLIEGRFIETLSVEELVSRFGLVDLLPDVFDGMTYTDEPSKVLSLYLNALKDDGEIFIVAGATNDIKGIHKEKIKTKKGEISFLEWFKANKTIKVKITTKTLFKFPGYPLPDFTVINIKKKRGVKPVFKELVLDGKPVFLVENGEKKLPPLRTFKEID